MMKKWISFFCVLLLSIFCSGVFAQDDGGEGGDGGGKKKKVKKEKKPRAPLEDLTLEGKLTKQERTRKRKDGKESTSVSYVLETSDGKVTLPRVRKSKGKKKKKKGGDEGGGEEAPKTINYEDYVDQNVTVTGKGTKQTKGEKTRIRLKKVTSIEAAGGADDAGAAEETTEGE